MILKKADFLSPQITLYHKGFLSHSSIASGIISIISFIIIIIFGVYYSLDLIKRENPKLYFFNSVIDKSEEFPLNSSSVFHYISFIEGEKVQNFDSLSFRLIGFESYYSIYFYSRNISQFDHWLYGLCNFEIDTKGLNTSLFDKGDFEKSLCIKKFYNSIDNVYYDINHPNFRWPKISHGSTNELTIYSIFMEKCEEDTLELILGKGNKCNNISENYFSGNWGTKFNFIDNLVSVLEYKKPNKQYIYTIENTLDKDNFSINHINFNPSVIKTYNGVIFENLIKEFSYIFDRNDVFMEANKNNNIFMIFTLYMKNRMQCYKRIYKSIQDVLSDIGGVSEFITLLASHINSFYNNYNILFDFDKLISTSINKKNKNKIKNDKELTNIDINSHNIETNKSETENTNFENNLNSNNEIINKKNSLKQNSNINNNAYIKEKEYKEVSEIIINKSNENIDIKNNTKFKFWNFILHKLSSGKKNNYFTLYENFRMKIMSEENLLNNYLDIYSLIQTNKINGFELENNYKIKDLINIE